MHNISLRYDLIDKCPLCGSNGISRAKLLRNKYYFGSYSLPLPDVGVYLIECTNCSLLYKSAIPDKQDLAEIMTSEATDVWRSKPGIHPALIWILPYIDQKHRVLDIGASNGDLIAQLKMLVKCVSALDVLVYNQCRSVINGEYIIGDIEGSLIWSKDQYEVITAFDVFEHFLNAKAAIMNIDLLVKKSGKIIIETGDWTCIKYSLGEWYYANLFEHNVFWCRKTFEYLCMKYPYKIIKYENIIHKNRREIKYYKKALIETILSIARVPIIYKMMLLFGYGDPLRLAPPLLRDHAFVVMEKSYA